MTDTMNAYVWEKPDRKTHHIHMPDYGLDATLRSPARDAARVLLCLDASEDTTMAVYHIGRDGRMMLSRSAPIGELARIVVREEKRKVLHGIAG